MLATARRDAALFPNYFEQIVVVVIIIIINIITTITISSINHTVKVAYLSACASRLFRLWIAYNNVHIYTEKLS